MTGRKLYRRALFLSLLVVLAAFLLWPIFLTVRGGFVDGDGRFTLDYLTSVLAVANMRDKGSIAAASKPQAIMTTSGLKSRKAGKTIYSIAHTYVAWPAPGGSGTLIL